MDYDISGQRIDERMVRAMFTRRERNAHKGHFGHALLVAGQRGMLGAALLATGAALRSGCGLVTAHIPADERLAVHILHPSAILSLDPDICFSELPSDMTRYTAVGAGPGLGQSEKTASALLGLMKAGLPMVLDADALNLISSHPDFFAHIPHGSVLTPHIGELRRLLRSALTASVIRCPELSVSDWKSDDSCICIRLTYDRDSARNAGGENALYAYEGARETAERIGELISERTGEEISFSRRSPSPSFPVTVERA